MIHNPDSRLLLAASMVEKGRTVADIGCDHAFLSIYLVNHGIAKSVIASDVRRGPLETARANVTEAGLSDKIELRLLNGLDGISPKEADEIVICGMGGILICDILSRAEWTKDENKHIILQPMTDSDVVRRWLYENGFAIDCERAVKAAGRIYSVISASYTGVYENIDDAFAAIGKLSENMSQTEKEYIIRETGILKKRLSGLCNSKKPEEHAGEICKIGAVVSQLEQILED